MLLLFLLKDELFEIDKELLYTGDWNMRGHSPVPPVQGTTILAVFTILYKYIYIYITCANCVLYISHRTDTLLYTHFQHHNNNRRLPGHQTVDGAV